VSGERTVAAGTPQDARSVVLARVRAALAGAEGGGTGPSFAHGAGPTEPQHLTADSDWETGTTGDALLELLTDRIVDYRATVTRATSAEVPATVAALLADAGRVVVPGGLDPAWVAAITASGATVLVDEPGAPVDLAELDAADAVVTGSRLAVAETGTIVLDASPDQGRRAISLVPDHHVCVVRAGDVVRGLPAAMTRLDVTRPLTWISGPSATSDIELDRVEGVHGPRRLEIVLVVDGEAPAVTGADGPVVTRADAPARAGTPPVTGAAAEAVDDAAAAGAADAAADRTP
jgi:L-lactate dehydrogenase complex protein LldG